MKKRMMFVLVGLLAFVSFGFTQGFEIGGTYGRFSSDDLSVSAFGLNIAGTGAITETIGYGVYGNIMYGTYKDVSLIPIDLLIGPTFKVINNGSFALPIAVGFYMINSFAFGEDAAGRGFNIGAGGNITAELKFGRNMHLYIRLQGAYEFLGDVGELVIEPSIGIGF
jgi:hypothetical protein